MSLPVNYADPFQVVNQDSATLNYAEKEQSFPINGNHHEICKFGDPRSETFAMMGGSIRAMVQKAVGCM